MSVLPPAERKRLADLLGRLGSDHPGERDNAGVIAHRLITARGLSWPEIVDPPPPVEHRSEPLIGPWRATCQELAKRQGSLRKWEVKFVNDLPQVQRISSALHPGRNSRAGATHRAARMSKLGTAVATSEVGLDRLPFDLRPYQDHCIVKLRHCYASGHRAPLLCLPTAGGKTVVFTAISYNARRKGKKVLVCVHPRELLKQAVAKLAWAGLSCGIIAPGVPPDYARQVRLDGKGLGKSAGGCFDALVIGPEVKELTDQGFLSPARCFVPARRLNLRGVKTVAGDYDRRGLEQVVDAKIIVDAVGDYRRHADHRSCIAYCISIKHAKDTAQAFRDAGYRSVAVSGKTPITKRDAAIAGLADGSVEVLCSCDLISEGLDVPVLGAVILLRPTKSLVLHKQQVGRGLRPSAGKMLVVLDHVGKPRTVTTAAGHLTELTPKIVAQLKSTNYYSFLAQPRTEAELKAFAEARDYKPGWVYHQLQAQKSALAAGRP